MEIGLFPADLETILMRRDFKIFCNIELFIIFWSPSWRPFDGRRVRPLKQESQFTGRYDAVRCAVGDSRDLKTSLFKPFAKHAASGPVVEVYFYSITAAIKEQEDRPAIWVHP